MNLIKVRVAGDPTEMDDHFLWPSLMNALSLNLDFCIGNNNIPMLSNEISLNCHDLSFT